MAKKIKIGMWNDSDENWTILASFKTEESADNALDTYCNKYPHAWIEILDSSLNVLV